MVRTRRNRLHRGRDIADSFGITAGDLGWNLMIAIFILAILMAGQTALHVQSFDPHLAETASGNAPAKAQSHYLSINAQGQLSLDSQPMAGPSDLSEHLRAALQPPEDDSSPEQHQVLIVPDAKAPWQAITMACDVTAQLTTNYAVLTQQKGVTP
jgi:biopolymer transport protein ExbD